MRLSRHALLRRALLPGVAAAAFAFSAFSAAGCKPSGGGTASGGTTGGAAGGGTGTIKVGHLASMTGSTATFGTETDSGIRFAMEELNAAGGVDGKKFEVQTLDNRSLPEEARTVATKFTGDDSIVAVIGDVSSGRTIAAAPVLDRKGIPMVSPAATNAEVTKKGPHVFRVCFIDPFQGYAMAKFAKDNLKLTKVAILRDKKNEYSVGLADVFAAEFKKLGGTIVGDAAYQEGDSDFRAQLAQLKAAAPEALFVPGYYGEVGPIAQQSKELGLNVPLLGGDGWDSPDLVKGAGGALEGSYFSTHYSPDEKRAKVESFVKDYQGKYGKQPSGNAALGYDAMMILADAIKRAGSVDREAITKALAETKGFDGVTGNITIDAERNAQKPATILQVKGDAFTFSASIAPQGAAGGSAAAASSSTAAPAAEDKKPGA